MSNRTPTAKGSQPNFLIFITDQFHPACLGYAGHPVVNTPNIDRLAADGMIFTRAYSNQPLCMPARATLFTGRTPRGHGVRMNGISLDPSIPTFTDALRSDGYRTHCCGKIHLHLSGTPGGTSPEKLDPAAFPENRALWLDGTIQDLPSPFYGLESVDYANGHGHNSYGHFTNWLKSQHPDQAHLFFDRVPLESPSPAADLFNRNSYKWALPAELHPAAWIADRAIGFLDEVESDKRPFALMCSFPDPHPPFAPPAPYCYHYNPDAVPPPTGRQGEHDLLPPHFRQMRETPVRTSGNHSQSMSDTDPYRAECAAHYYGLIEMLDDQVGRVMDSLQANDLAKNTIVFFLADHGEALGDHGMWGKGPYHFDGVIRVPFLASWPGHIAPASIHDGVISLVDFAPTILDLAEVSMPEGPTPPKPESAVVPAALPGRSLAPVLLGEADAPDRTALVEMDEDYLGFKMRTLVSERYRLTVYSGQEYGELFDLAEDPEEVHNLWLDPGYRALRDELQIRLLHKIVETDNSLPRQLGRA